MTRLGAIVPVRDEQDHLAGCLHALDRAATHSRGDLDLVVVLDSCRDDSRRVAVEAARSLDCRIHLLTIEARSVGTARQVGTRRLLDLFAAGGRDDGWLATTDADSRVPLDWFSRQLAHRDAGASLVVGTVHVTDWQGREWLRPHYERTYAGTAREQSEGHRHVHGANLAFSGLAYERVGGFCDATSDEDERLVRAFMDAGEPVVWATDLSVVTSARRVGRAPRGFADYLNDYAGSVDPGQPILAQA